MKNCRIAIAQINPTVGDLNKNTNKIIRLIKKYESAADLIIFPELSIVGYPPEDLILRKRLIDEVNKKIKKIINYIKNSNIAVILGAPLEFKKGIGNAAIFIFKNKVEIFFKNNLPNYGVFDEKRIFKAGTKYKCLKYKNIRIGILICEDMWSLKMPKNLIKDKVDLFVSINASPFDKNKIINRREVAKRLALFSKKPIIYLNQVGGQDELVFDGNSFAMNKRGEIIFNMTPWKEKVEVFSCAFFHSHKKKKINYKNIEFSQNFNKWSALVKGLEDYVYKNGFKKVILGLSGGIDSAVSAAIAVDAIGNKNVLGIRMPSKYSSRSSLNDALDSAKKLNIKIETLKINRVHQEYLTTISKVFNKNIKSITEENLQSRIRGTLLMAYSNNFSHLLLSTGNKSEISVGYSTIYGDMNGGFNVLKDIYKTELYELAKWRNKVNFKLFKGPKGIVIPNNSIQKEPSAELRLDQKDSDSLPPYETLDKILYQMIENEASIEEIKKMGFDEKLIKRIRALLLKAEYKRRQAPPGVKLSTKAFGKERRYPITNAFKV